MGRFAFDPLSSDLSFTVQLASAQQRDVVAVLEQPGADDAADGSGSVDDVARHA